jgi:hypothetical protein
MLGNAAQRLARRGLAVFPCLVGQKEPATANGLHAATTDATTIAAWWRQQPNYNVAIATGAVSQIFVLDVDNGDDHDGEAELKKLEQEHGSLPATVEAITGKGRHLYFKMPDCDLRNSASKLAPGVDIRANGGYALAPPSLHPSGRRYVWSTESANAFAPAPQWLLDKIATPASNGNGVPPAEWCDLLCTIPEGRRNDTIARIVGHLLRRRVDPLIVVEIAAAINIARCQSPLSADEVRAICDSICACELKRRHLS